MKIYKIQLTVIDFDGIGEDGIISTLQNTRYPNDCLFPKVIKVEHREIGEWDDDSPLNNSETIANEVNRLFGDGNG